MLNIPPRREIVCQRDNGADVTQLMWWLNMSPRVTHTAGQNPSKQLRPLTLLFRARAFGRNSAPVVVEALAPKAPEERWLLVYQLWIAEVHIVQAPVLVSLHLPRTDISLGRLGRLA